MNLSRYLADLLASEELRPSSRRSYESALRLHITPALGAVDMRELSPPLIRAFLADLRRDGAGPGTLTQCYRLLSKACRAALVDGLIDRNPMDAVKAPRAPRAELDPPTLTEVEAIRAAILPRYRASIDVLRWCGLRIGELGGLRVEDWDGAKLTVRQQATRDGLSQLKTAAARRTVYAPAPLVPALTAHLETFPAHQGLIFTTGRGGLVTADSFNYPFRTACRRAGVRAFHPHELRHHAVTAMVRSGASLKAVQRAVGHSSSKLTMDVYTHATEDDLEDLARRMGA